MASTATGGTATATAAVAAGTTTTETRNGKVVNPTTSQTTSGSSSATSSTTAATTTSSSSTSGSNSSNALVPANNPPEWGSRSVKIFEELEQVGAGTYGQVFRARNKVTGEVVALKKVRMDQEKEGLPITAIREIKILKELQHDNIVSLKEIVTAEEYNQGKGSIYMVFEYMDHDLTGLMDSPHAEHFSEAQIKCYMKQLLEGLFFCHKNNVLHRDVKGSNLLINNKGFLKLADFGLARFYNENAPAPYTNRVITLWYRPPELLLGSQMYGPAVDMWSAGCILGELLSRKPLFPGKDEPHQLELIWKMCGSPTEEDWPEASEIQLYNMFKPVRPYKRRLREVFKNFPEKGLDLLEKMLCLNPKNRITASAALDHDFFWTDPMPLSPSNLPQYESCHEWQNKKRKQEKQQKEMEAKRVKSDANGRPIPWDGRGYAPHNAPYPPPQGHPSHHPPQHGAPYPHNNPPHQGHPPQGHPSHHPPHHSSYQPSHHHPPQHSSSHSTHPPHHSSGGYSQHSSSHHSSSNTHGHPQGSSQESRGSAYSSNPWGTHPSSRPPPPNYRPASSSSSSGAPPPK